MSRGDYDYLIKLLLIGDSGVGKSSLLIRFTEDSFNPNFITTIGIDFKIRNVEIDGKRVKIQVWDTAGQERFRTITTAYYRSAMGILLVYDVTDEKSFENVKGWMKNIEDHASVSVLRMLVANKTDMADEMRVDPSMGEALANEYGIPFVQASARTGEGVDDAFLTMTKMVMEKLFSDDSAGSAGGRVNVSNKRSGDGTSTRKFC